MTRRRELIAGATQRLREGGVASPEYDATELLAHVLGTSRSQLVLVDDVPTEEAAAYDVLIERRAKREPLQHLTGVAHFRHVELAVGPGVFVPRPETELLAGWAIEQATAIAPAVVVDLCTGSGAIAKAVKDEVPAAVVHAVELGEAMGRLPHRLLVYAIEGDRFGLGEQLSPEVQAAIDLVADEIAAVVG